MYLIFFVCAAGAGFWAGGQMNELAKQYAQSDVGESISAIPMRFLAAIALGLTVLSISFSPEWFIALPFALALTIICICDIRYMIIPDVITLPGIASAAVLRIFIHPLPFWDYIAAALIGSGLFYLAALLIRFLSNTDAVGGGDIKLLALTGLVLGIKLTVLSFLMFSLAGMVAGILIILSGKLRKNMIIPFGPFIAAASLISYYWGSDGIKFAFSILLK
ncbi:prepilin peptidase [Paenibacillus gansuensis]|uniref:Prepilin peptidase n=1 Tax=Paenibacillus gansuensis TaxID=306542 RepID=A0ABW5PIW9_9BACL